MGHLPEDADERKALPIYTGFIRYFPDAIVAITKLSMKGNDQHNPDTEVHWDRAKSGDEKDALARHLLDIEEVDNDGVLHATKVAWRALAYLQKMVEDDKEVGPLHRLLKEGFEEVDPEVPV